MDGKQFLTYGLIGGAGYFLYKAFMGGSAAHPLSQANCPAGTVFQPNDLIGGGACVSGGASMPGPAAAPAAPPPASVTTPTVTTPAAASVVVSPASLISGAVASGNPTMLTPDQWNWIIGNVLRGQTFNVDASFGVSGGSGRTANYSAQDFYDIATGAKSLPGSSQNVSTQVCPPSCGSDPATAVNSLAQILEKAAPGISEYRPDQWNWFVNGYYDMDQLFGPVGSPHRDGTYTARQFAGVAIAGVADPTGGMSGLVDARRQRYSNAILRPNIPGTRRWVPEAQRYGVRSFIDSKGGWAV